MCCFYLQATIVLCFLLLCTVCTVRSAASQTALRVGPELSIRIRTNNLEAVTLITRPPHPYTVHSQGSQINVYIFVGTGECDSNNRSTRGSSYKKSRRTGKHFRTSSYTKQYVKQKPRTVLIQKQKATQIQNCYDRNIEQKAKETGNRKKQNKY